jgi:hypothetical protein
MSRPLHTSRRTYTHRDRLGVEINANDTVLVIAWGVARLVDTGTKSRIVKINRKRIVIIDSDGYDRSVSPSELAVLRRDGENGLEGNRV